MINGFSFIAAQGKCAIVLRPAHRLIQLSVPSADTNTEARVDELRQRLRAMPGVASVGRSFSLLNRTTYATKVGTTFSDTIGVGARGPSAEFVDVDFLNAIAARVAAGRRFSADDEFSPTTVLAESLARELFPDGPPIGACVHIREPESPCRTVVGIVRDVAWDVGEATTYRLYIPLIQSFTRGPSITPVMLYIRVQSAASPNDICRIRELAASVASDRQVLVQRVDDLLEPIVRPWQMAARLFVVLGLLGLAAATTGIYGVVAFDVSERSRELGVRIALGATRGSIMRLVIGSGLHV
jgi:hypothetical protein